MQAQNVILTIEAISNAFKELDKVLKQVPKQDKKIYLTQDEFDKFESAGIINKQTSYVEIIKPLGWY